MYIHLHNLIFEYLPNIEYDRMAANFDIKCTYYNFLKYT